MEELMADDNQLQRRSEDAVAKNDILRISTAEREKAITRLQVAFAEGRINDMELDNRVLGALAAKTNGDIEKLLGDLPPEPATPAPSRGKKSEKFIAGYGSTVKRSGRWKVAAKVRPVIFKGHMVLDLRAAELTGRETLFNVFAYKGTIEVIVLPGISVETDGFTYKGEWINELADDPSSSSSPTIRIHGIAYKSKVIVRHANMTAKPTLPPQEKSD
jgi:hypothetical protein